MVRRGDKLQLIFSTKAGDGIIAAIALEDGSLGQTIQCRSTLGKAVLTGQIVNRSDGSVYLDADARGTW